MVLDEEAIEQLDRLRQTDRRHPAKAATHLTLAPFDLG